MIVVLKRDFGARRQRSVCIWKRSGEDENISSREQDQAAGEKANLGCYLSPHSVGTSCRLKYSSGKNSFTQNQAHLHRQSTSSSLEFHPHHCLCHQSEALPRESCMKNCSNMSRKDENNPTLNIDEIFQTALEENKRNDKNTISGYTIPTPMQNRRKMLVCNGGISPNWIATGEAMSSKSVKRLREASVEGRVINNESADANNFISCDLDLQPNNISLPFAAQQEDRRKGKAIVSGGMVERDKNNCTQLLQRRDFRASIQEDRRKDKAIVSGDMVERDKNKFVQLLQRRKRLRVNSSSSREVEEFTVCKYGSPRSSAGLATQGKILDCRNDVFLNSSRDDASEGNIMFACKPHSCSSVHHNKRQLARLDKTRGGLPSLSLVGDLGNSSEAGSPEIIFLGSYRSSQRNHSFTSRNSNVVQELSCDVEVDDHTPIDVDSLEYPINEIVNLEESNKEASARARQIEQDELLARQIQEELAQEKGEGGVQVSFETGGREPSHSLTIHPSLPPFSAGHSTCPLHRRRDGHSTFSLHRRRDGHSTCPLHRRRDGHSTYPLHRRRDGHSTCPLHRRRDGDSTCPLHRRRDALSGRWHQASGRPFHCSRFQFPSHRNIEMRVDVLEAIEHAVESNATHQFLARAQRDFNENDYDMLLVLDDDNNNQKGASQRHIDRLPISTVQNEISDEVCSICLEMQKSGDVIRRLLCMHKFHKECIDPWLAIQASCPICKLSI